MEFGLKSAVDNLSSDFQNQLNSKANSKVDGGASPLPWDNATRSKFFKSIDIKTDNWDQLFPYRILVIDALNGNKIVNGNIQTSVARNKEGQGTGIIFKEIGRQWLFTLPITPQQLNIQDLFAINTTATLGGIVEEHGGVKFKMINAQGTMGVWASRESVTKPPSSPTLLQSFFGGTIEAVGSVLSQVARTINTITSGSSSTKPITVRPEASLAGSTSTGFYQAQALQQFLEQYAEAKKDPANKGWRLVFDVPKQNQSFVVTPVQFTWQQSAQKPLEVMYNLQFKAWRRIDLKDKAGPIKLQIDAISPGLLQRILNTISEARKTLAAVTNLIGAVRSDVTKPLEVLRQTSLFIKDLAGVAITAADMPNQVVKDYESSISESLKNIDRAVLLARLGATGSAAFLAIENRQKNSEGLSSNSVKDGQLGTAASQAITIDPAAYIFANPEKQVDLLDQVDINSLTLTEAQQAVADDVIQQARQLTVDDLRSFRATINELSLQLSNNFGTGDAYYSKIYSKPLPKERVQPLTLDEYQILRVLYDAIQAYDSLAATTDIDDAQNISNMDYVAGLADLSGIEFTTTQSKILVPVPVRLTIENIALRYLGDAQRWIEIVTLNNLRSPYIDEDGFKYSLLSNGTGRQITISSQENLYVGQRILLRSINQPQSARRILGIDRLSDTSFLLTLDGDPNLDAFTTADSAYVQAYLPGTVNSQQKIFIPSDLPVSDDPSIAVPSSVKNDPLVGMSKVDWLITDNGDLATNNFGDFRLSAGMTNIIQALRIKIGTQKGKLLLHPEFGLGIRAGEMISDMNAQRLFDDLNVLITADNRFDGLDTLQIQLDGSTLSINIGVRLSGNNGVFPVTFDLPV